MVARHARPPAVMQEVVGRLSLPLPGCAHLSMGADLADWLTAAIGLQAGSLRASGVAERGGGVGWGGAVLCEDCGAMFMFNAGVSVARLTPPEVYQ